MWEECGINRTVNKGGSVDLFLGILSSCYNPNYVITFQTPFRG